MEISKLAPGLLLTIFVFLAAAGATEAPQTLLAVLDSPIDYTHPDLAPVIAKDLLVASRFKDDDGTERSWWDLNQKERKRLEDAIDWRYFNDEIAFLEERGTSAGIPNHAENLANVLTYVHGTHVAGIAANGAGVRILNFPLNTLDAPFDLAKALAFDPAQLRSSTHRRIQAVSEALLRHRIRIVNVSLSSSNSLALSHAENGATDEQKQRYAEHFRKIAEADAKILRDELAWLYAQNPSTIFVVSAGNQNLDLEKMTDHTATLEAPNVLKVASLDEDGRLAGFSNYSRIYVQVAAPGMNIVSALARGGQLRLNGTSQSAPLVARRLGMIFAANEKLSAAEALSEFFDKHTIVDPELAEVVRDGRVLRPNPRP